jgi:ABC-2 type transport system ATP-binding protein
VSTPAIETEQLTKHFAVPRSLRQFLRHPFTHKRQDITAVDGVSIQVREGELFGLLGPNGAGKTTLIKMLCTLVLPSSGRARIAGIDLAQDGEVRQLVGMASGDERSFYWRLTGRQNLAFFGALYGLRPQAVDQRVQALLRQVNLVDQADRPFRTYSSGQKQRLSIARALLHRPRVLFLDEPTRSLDPAATARLHDFIREELMRREGMTILLTTHRLEEAHKLCERIAIMDGGRIQALGTPDELRVSLGPHVRYRIVACNLAGDPDALAVQLHGALRATWQDQEGCWLLELEARQDSDALGMLLQRIALAGGLVREVTQERPSLEGVFAHFTERGDPKPG